MSNLGHGKIILNCQHSSIQGAGGAGRYAANLAKGASNLESLGNYDFVVENLPAERSQSLYRFELIAKDFLKNILPRSTFERLKNLYLKKSIQVEENVSHSLDEKPVLLHEISNYYLHPTASRSLNNQNFKIVSTFLDIQDFYYPQYFSDKDLTHRRLHYAFFKSYCSAFIAISEFTKQTMIEKLGIPPEKIRVIHLAAEKRLPQPDSAFEQNVKKLGKYFIYPAKLWKHKNHDFLLAVVSDLKNEFRKNGFKLVLCGGFHRNEETNLRQLLRTLKIDDIVSIQGFLSSNRLNLLISNAQYLVFPSLFEGFGMPVLEAMGLDCPVISSNAGSLPEVCGDAALLFNPHEKQSLELIFQNIFEGKVNRADLISKGQANLQRFSWDKCISETVKVYQEVLEGPLEL